jgi:hypothetical protein
MSFGDEVVALRWERPGTGGHRDLSLRLADWTHCCDSYYFAIEAEDAGPGPASVARVIQALLRQWKERVLQLADGDVVHLPFDFSDQCTAWLRVQRSGEQLELQAGWSSLEGYLTTREEWDRAVTHSSAALRRHCR